MIQPEAAPTAGFTARQVEDGWLDTLPCRRRVWSAGPAEVAERSHGFTGEVVGGEPVVVHHSEGQTGESVSVLFRTHMAGRHGGQISSRNMRKRQRQNLHSQVKEFVEHGVQRLELHLCALTLCDREEVVRAELHDDKRITQT